MKFETVEQAIAALDKHQQTMAAYNHALGVLYHDGSTAAPKDSWQGRSQTMGIMSEITYELSTKPEIAEMLVFLEANAEALTPIQQRQVEVLRKGYDQMHKIPAEEYVAYSVLVNDAENIWAKAKNENDFAAFSPYLEKIVSYNRKFAGYYNPEMAPYDALLNEYEEGMNTKTLDAFFSQLRETIVPLIGKIQNAEPIDDSFLYKIYPVEAQRKLSDYLMEVMGLNRNHCGIAESEHPYTTNFNNKDVRITTHYYENNLASSMYSVIHEGGHALYELGADDCYNFTNLSGGVSMGIHESQSRFYENIIGRSRSFVYAVYPKIKELFPEQLSGVDAEMLYKEYLGVDVPNDSMGCLQDTHWAGGMIGYFPSYALGSAYGAQMIARMQEEIGDVYADVAKGDLSKVTAWLKEKIHRHASFLKPGELFKSVCGEFDAKYFTDYLTAKYSELYNL